MAEEETKKYISKIKVNGEATPRLIKDSEARELIWELENAVADIGADVTNIQADYLKGADKTELAGLISDEETRAQGIESGLQTQINDIKADAAKVASGEKIIGKNANKELTTTLTISYDSTSRKVQLKGIDNALVSEFDASAFIKDGMLWGEQAFVADGTSHEVSITKGGVTQTHTFTGLTNKHQYLAFCFTDGAVPTATYSWEIVDLQDLVDVYTAGNGIDVTGNVITAVAKSGDKYIEVTATGIASKGIDAAIKVETDRAEAAEQAINDKIGTGGDEKEAGTIYGYLNDLQLQVNTEVNHRTDADTALSNRIGALENDTHTHSNKAELDKITSGDVAKWNAKQDALSFDGTYDASTNKVATVSTVTTALGDYVTLDTQQTVSGKKTFTSDVVVPNLNISGPTGSISNGVAGIELNMGNLSLKTGSSATDIYTATVPQKSGTIALTDDITITGVKLNGTTLTPDANKVVDLGSIATTAGVLDDASYTDATHKLVIHKGNGTNVVNHTFGALADKSSVSGTASITYTPTDITLNGTFTPTGTVAVTLKNASVLSSVKSAGTLPTYSHTGFSGGSLGTESKSKFATKVINARIDSRDDECLEFFEEANTNTNFYSDAVTAQGAFTPAAYGTDTFTQGAMPEFNSGTVAVDTATFAGTEDQAISTSGQYSKANATASVTAE